MRWEEEGAGRGAGRAGGSFFSPETVPVNQTAEEQLHLRGAQLLALFAKEPPGQGVELLAQNRVLAAGLFQGLAGSLQRLPQGGHLLLQQADLRLQRRVVHQSVNQTQRRKKCSNFFGSFCEIVFMLYAALSYQARRAPSFKSTPSSNNCKAWGARRILAPGSPALRGQ